MGIKKYLTFEIEIEDEKHCSIKCPQLYIGPDSIATCRLVGGFHCNTIGSRWKDGHTEYKRLRECIKQENNISEKSTMELMLAMQRSLHGDYYIED